jgi:dipeptidase E
MGRCTGRAWTAAGPWRFVTGGEPRTPICELDWRSLGVLEVTALPSIGEERRVPVVRETDVLLVAATRSTTRPP